MAQVLKYRFDVREPKVMLPRGCKIIHIGHQPGTDECFVNIWCKVYGDPAPVREMVFEVYGTGHEMGEEFPAGATTPGSYLRHIGTVICPNLVWHVFTRRVLPAINSRR